MGGLGWSSGMKGLPLGPGRRHLPMYDHVTPASSKLSTKNLKFQGVSLTT
ncbi:unnamed protein product [Callosobruchus maculatus]|uniref:Uncharacterized protein n=1 Tax=Callosobruchus maculatus TaxID=64391 RepID=A0A653CNX5_CALMS|nr:unnamed protein product [Callosobruchus maculatus]